MNHADPGCKQALKSADYESAKQFEEGGIVSMEIFKEWPEATRTGVLRHNIYDEKMKRWGEKGEGIAAKMVSTLDPIVARAAFGITLKKERGDAIHRRGMLLKKGPAKPAPVPMPLPMDAEKRARHMVFLKAANDKVRLYVIRFEQT